MILANVDDIKYNAKAENLLMCNANKYLLLSVIFMKVKKLTFLRLMRSNI